MSEKTMKVTDRRMFTPDGELRDEYKATVDPDRAPAPRVAGPEDEAAAPAERRAVASGQPNAEAAPQPAAAEPEDEGSGPRFTDLVAFLAQTAAAYLQQAQQGTVGGGMSAAEMLDMARLHVDLLDVLERKTKGNITAQDHTVLDDARRQLRLALG